MSFTNTEILTLAKAGFTAQQIAALNIIEDLPKATEPAPATEPTPATEPAPAAEDKAKEEAPAQGASLDDVLGAVNSLTKTFQNGFLQGAEQPKPVTAESILAEIINPPTKQL